MNIKCFLVVGASLLAGSLSADALYWMVDESQNKAGGFTYAQIKASKGEESYYLMIPDQNGADAIFADGVSESQMTGRSVGEGSGVWADIGLYGAGWSYSIQLWDLNDKLVGESASASFTDLITQGSISYQPKDQIEPVYASTPWSPTFAVPEPTTGLLVLFGAAMLALRRKRT